MEQALIEYIANSLWQVPLLAGGAWLLLRMVRPGPILQHRVWLAVLATAIVFPLHGIERSNAGRPSASYPTVIAHTHMAAVIESDSVSLSDNGRPIEKRWTGVPARIQSVHLTAATAHWLVGLYLATIVFGLLRFARAWRAALRLVADSRKTELSHQAIGVLDSYGQRFGVKLPQLLESSDVLSPVIVGVVRPVLLLPENFAQHTEDEIKAALCHELAHVRRRDYLVNLVCQVMALPVAWHPATAAVQQRIRRTREMVCDAMAAEEMKSEAAYTRCLVALAQGTLEVHSMAGRTQALGLFDNKVLEERVMRLMEKKVVMSMREQVARVAAGVAVMIGALAVAFVFHVTPAMANMQTTIAPPAATQRAPQTPPAASSSESAAPPAAIAHDSNARPLEQGTHTHRSKGTDGEPLVVLNHERQALTPEQQRLIAKEIVASKKQIAEANKMLNSTEFKLQIRNALKVKEELKLEMPEIQEQVTEATAKLDSPEFRQKMADLQSRIQMQNGEIQRKVKEATATLDSPEFRQKMADLQKQLQIQGAELQHRLQDQLGNTQVK